MTKKAPKPTPEHTGLRNPTEFVRVPRSQLNDYWHLPWADVRAAALALADGLALVTDRPLIWTGPQQGEPPEPDIAFLTEGQYDLTGRTVLYQQNW